MTQRAASFRLLLFALPALVLALSPAPTAAQQTNIDSLQKVIETTTSDTTRGRTLCRLCEEASAGGDLVAARAKADHGLALVQKRKDREGEAICFNSIGKLLKKARKYQEAISQYLKSRTIYKATGDRKGEALSLKNIGNLYWDLSDYDKALHFHHESLKIRRDINDAPGIAASMGNIGSLYQLKGDYSKALEYMKKSLKMREQAGDFEKMVNNYINISGIYLKQGNYTEALVYLHKSLAISEKSGNLRATAANLVGIGMIKKMQGEYDEALDNYKRGMELFQKRGDAEEVATCLNNIGSIMQDKRDYNGMLKYFLEALEIQEALGNKSKQAAILANIGVAYFFMKDNARSLEYYQKSLEICNEIGDQACAANSISNIGNAYLNIGDFAAARTNAAQAHMLARDCGNLLIMQDAAGVLYKADSALGDWRGAFAALNLYKQYSDSLKNDDKSRELGRIESNYEFEKAAEDERRRADAAARLAEAAATRRNNLQYLSIFAGLLALFGALVFLGRFRVPMRAIEVAFFALLLIVFEFILVLTDPWIEDYSDGLPLYKLGLNTLIAFAFAPAHHFLLRRVRTRFARSATGE